MPTIDTGRATLNYRFDGPEDAPVAVFSNSVGTTLAMWEPQVAALSGRLRCLRYDTRGHGLSPVVPGPCTVEDLADDLAGLLDALGIASARVVGLSLGGMTAQALAVRRPDLVERLAIVASAAHLPPAQSWRDRAATVRREGTAAIAGAVLSRWFVPAHQDGPAALATLRDFQEAIDREGYALCCEAIAAMDLRPRIGAIRAPTLVVCGAEDPATPVAMGEEIRALVPGATLRIVPDAAHLVALDQPDALNRILSEFLGVGGGGGRGRVPTPLVRDGGEAFAAGVANRRAVLGDAHVDRSLAAAGAFGLPWQDFITRYAWGEIWGDDTLPWKTRSAVVLSITASLGREEEFKLHLRPALANGFTPAELRALLQQVAVYAGVPAANTAFRWMRDALGDELP